MENKLNILYLFESPISKEINSRTLGFGELRVIAAQKSVGKVVGIGRKGPSFYELKGETDKKTKIEKKISVIRYMWPRQLIFYYFSFLPLLWHGFKYCYQNQVNIIHAESPHISGIAAILLGAIFRIRTVIEIKVTYKAVAKSRYGKVIGPIFFFGYKVLSGLIVKRATIVLANCERAKRDVLSLYPQLRLVDNYCPGVMPPKRIVDYNSNFFTVGFLGRLYPDKGVIFFLCAIALSADWFRSHNVRFAVGGDGPQRDRAEEFIRKNNLKDLVTMRGNVDRWEFLSQMKLMVNTTVVAAALEMVIAESQTLGIPVVSFGADGFPETVKDNYSGYVVPVGDMARLARSIKKLVTNKELYALMSRRAKLHAMKYAFDTQAKGLEVVYERIMQ